MVMQYQSNYQINNPSVELAKEIIGIDGENASGIQPVYKSIKNIRLKKPCKIWWKIFVPVWIFTQTLPENIIQHKKLVSRSEAVKFIHLNSVH